MKASRFIRLHNNNVANPANKLDPDWEFMYPVQPPAYSTNVMANAGDITCRCRGAKHQELVQRYEVFMGLEHVFKQCLQDAYNDCLKKDDILGYIDHTVRELLDHLAAQCLVITDVNNAQKRCKAYLQWDKNNGIHTVFDNIGCMADELDNNYGLEWIDDMKVIMAIKAMYKSSIFTKEEMHNWEQKGKGNRIWVHLWAYFVTFSMPTNNIPDSQQTATGLVKQPTT